MRAFKEDTVMEGNELDVGRPVDPESGEAPESIFRPGKTIVCTFSLYSPV